MKATLEKLVELLFHETLQHVHGCCASKIQQLYDFKVVTEAHLIKDLYKHINYLICLMF